MIEFRELDKAVLTSAEAMQYLSLDHKSSLDKLVAEGRLTPLRIAKEHLFAKSELDGMIERELALQREKRRPSASTADGISPNTP